MVVDLKELIHSRLVWYLPHLVLLLQQQLQQPQSESVEQEAVLVVAVVRKINGH